MDNNEDSPQYQFNQSMEKSKKGLQITIILLILAVLGLAGYIVYNKFIVTEFVEPTAQAVELPNNYGLFKKNLTAAVKKYSDDQTKTYYLSEQFIDSKDVTGGYSVYLTGSEVGNGELHVKFFDQTLIDKFGNPKIADDVLSFYIYASGNGGFNTIYMIKKDGSVSSTSIETIVNGQDNFFSKDNVGGYKNIVSVIGGLFGDGQGEAKGPIFIDINGNIYSPNITE